MTFMPLNLSRPLTAFIVGGVLIASGLAGSVSAAASSAASGGDPSLAVMNANGDHTMGSTIPATQGAQLPEAAPMLQERSIPAGLAGLDVSGYQGVVNWQAAWNNGARFAYVKATEGTTYASSSFTQQYNGSYSVGMTRGAYHFATPDTSTGAAQARYFVSHGGGWSADGRTLPPLLDIEYGYNATCWGLNQASMVSWITDFSNTVLGLTGIRPGIYSTTDWWTQCTGNSSQFSANPLFIAHYTTASSPGTLPSSWSAWSFWQYANAGIFPGDEDVFNGTQAVLTTLARGGSAPAGSSPPTVVSVSGTTMTAGQSVRSVNGQYVATLQSDGNLVLYGNGRALWSSGTSSHPGAHFIAQGDGNAVIYSTSGQVLWTSNTAGKGTDPKFEVLNSGDLALVSTSGTTWKSIQSGTDTLGAGSSLTGGQYLHDSANDVQFIMQTDGNLVLYRSGKPAWASWTNRYPGAHLTLQTDGNLVIYDTHGVPRWNSHTGGKGPGTRLITQTDGSTVLYQGSSRIWGTNRLSTSTPTTAIAASDTLMPGSQLAPGKSIGSPTGNMRFIMQTDGNLVLYRSGKTAWASWTNRYPGAHLALQTDGNLVIYDTHGVPRWNSHTGGKGPGTRLIMQGDGNVVLYEGSSPLWNTRTGL